MSKATYLALSVAMGVTAGSLSLTLPASAITVNRVTPTADWTKLGWIVEGRAGADPINAASSQDDYEIAIGPKGADNPLFGQQDWVWGNGEEVNWSLNWNGSTAAFQFGNLAPIFYQPSASTNVFNGFYLLTKSQTRVSTDPRTYVDPDTTIDLLVKTLNGEIVTDRSGNSLFSSATSPASGKTLTQPFFSSDVPITSLTGIAKMSWTGRNPQTGNGRSYVDFQIAGYNIKDNDVSVPEPTSALSLLAFGVLGVGSILKKRQQKI